MKKINLWLSGYQISPKAQQIRHHEISTSNLVSPSWVRHGVGREGYTGIHRQVSARGIWGVMCGPACAGDKDLGCSGAASTWGSQWLSSSFYSGMERKVCFPLVTGDRGHFKHHLFDPNSAFKRELWRLSAAHPGVSDHIASPSLLA